MFKGKNKGDKSRLFFAISPGRSGSSYLSHLLNTSKDVVSFHEADPKMTAGFLSMVSDDPFHRSFEARKVKANFIKAFAEQLPRGKIYCETNHMFIKTFFDVVISEFLENVEVIILRRDIAKVLKSFVELGYFSQLNENWPQWMSSPNSATSAIACIAEDSELDQYDLCIAYIIDIEARAQRFRKEYPWIKSYEVDIEELNDYESIERLFSQLKITPSKKTKASYKNKVNHKSSRKQQLDRPVDINYCCQRIDEYIDRARKMNICVPKTLCYKSLTQMNHEGYCSELR